MAGGSANLVLGPPERRERKPGDGENGLLPVSGIPISFYMAGRMELNQAGRKV